MWSGTAPDERSTETWGLVIGVHDRSQPASVLSAIGSTLRSAGVDWVVVESDRAESLADTAAAAGRPLGFVGVDSAGDATVAAAARHGQTAAVVLVTAPLSGESLSVLAEWSELPLLAVVDVADRARLQSATDAYLSSANPRSGLQGRSPEETVAARVSSWLRDRLAEVPEVDDVMLTTSDGWEIFGTLVIPSSAAPVPGIVLLHSGRSDRSVFAKLQRLVSEHGVAVLNIDWRGRGQSVGRGSYLDLTDEDNDNRWRDAAAALDHLGALPQIDPDRLATLGVVQGAEIAARAAQRDSRVKAVALLTGYKPGDEEEAQHLTSGEVDVMYVASTDHGATTQTMRELYERSAGRHSRYVEYPGALLGYQLFEIDPTLEQTIAAWLAEVLRP